MLDENFRTDTLNFLKAELKIHKGSFAHRRRWRPTRAGPGPCGRTPGDSGSDPPECSRPGPAPPAWALQPRPAGCLLRPERRRPPAAPERPRRRRAERQSCPLLRRPQKHLQLGSGGGSYEELDGKPDDR